MTYKWFNSLLNIFVFIFYILAILSSLYVFTYTLNNPIKTYVFIGLIVLSILVYILLKKKRNITIINKLKSLSEKTILKIMIISSVVLKIIYSLLLYFDPTSSNDVSAEYIHLFNRFINNDLTNTTGDHLFNYIRQISLYLSLKIPHNIVNYLLIILSLIFIFKTFKDVIGKEKSFIAVMAYLIMPSTTLLSFTLTPEIHILFFLSLFVYLIHLLNKETKIYKIIIYSILIILNILLCTSISYVGYLLLLIIFIDILLSNLNSNSKYALTIILVMSIVCINIYNFSYAYEWRTIERTYYSLITGSNLENYGRFIEGYPRDIVNEIVSMKSLDGSHEVRQEILNNLLINNYQTLLSNPIKLLKLLANKFYILWSGNHYSIEMLNNVRDIDNTLYFGLLGINEIIYLIMLLPKIMHIKNNRNVVCTNILILLLMIAFACNFIEANNRFVLFMTPFIYIVSLSGINKDDIND